MTTILKLFFSITMLEVVLAGGSYYSNYGGNRYDNSYSSESYGGHHGSVEACPAGWTEFQRIKGRWCIKVFPPSIVGSTGESMCNAQGATLTGVENANERLFIHSEAVKFLGPNTYSTTYIGGRRRGPCYASNWLTLPQCMPKQTKSFKWTDNFTTGDAGWAWQTNPSNPDNYLTGQSYAGIIVVTGTWLTVPSIRGQVVGPMDDYTGQGTGGYACGRRPERRRSRG